LFSELIRLKRELKKCLSKLSEVEIENFISLINNLSTHVVVLSSFIGLYPQPHSNTFEKLLNMLSLFVLVFTDNNKIHEAEVSLDFYSDEPLSGIKIIAHEKEYNFNASFKLSGNIEGIYYCQECKEIINFSFDPEATMERWKNFYEDQEERLPQIDQASTLREYLKFILILKILFFF